MKIAIDIRTAVGEKAGKGWYTFSLIKSLLELDKINTYFLYTTAIVPEFKGENVHQQLIKGPGFLWHFKAARQALADQVDLYFAPTSYITPFFLSKKIKLLITVHDLVALLFPIAHNKKAVFAEKVFLRLALGSADKILAVSTNTSQDLIKKFPATSSKLAIVHAAASEKYQRVDPEILKKFAHETKLPAKFFLAVSTLEPRKNYPNLIHAFAMFSQKNPHYHLIIVGREGWNYQEIYQTVRDHNLSAKVHFLGYLSDGSINKLYNLAEALVFPSYYEGFGIPPLEAMKCGCPVITSFTSSLPEVVGSAGLLINPEKPQEIASAMQEIASKPTLRQALVQRGLIQSKKFSWQASATKLLEIIQQLA